MDKIISAAQAIAAARRARAPLAALPADIAPSDEAEGYAVQRALHDLLLPSHGARVGHKIGCTSKVMQDYLGIPHPCAGGVFERGVHESGARLARGDFIRVGVECEIAMRLARDLMPTEAPFTAEGVMTAVDACHPAIEIVDDRYVRWDTLGAPTLIADDFFAAGCVLGEPTRRADLPDLRRLTGRALIDGTEAGRGRGADVLGDPGEALAWLANHLAKEGKGLRAGQLVLTGSLVRTVWLEAGCQTGCHVAMELAALGRVEATFD